MIAELKDVLARAAWRAGDGFLSALALDAVFDLGVAEWKVAMAAAVSAGVKPISQYVKSKASRTEHV